MLCQSYVPAPFGIEPFLELHGGSLDAPKRWRQEVAKPHLFRMRLPMRDNERRRRFMEFFNTELRGDRRLLMDKTGLTKGRVSQLFDPGEPFGEKAAASLAEKLNLPRDYFDRDEAPPTRESRLDTLSPFEVQLVTFFRLLPEDRRHELLIELNNEVNARVAGLAPTPANPFPRLYTGPERRVRDEPVPYERRRGIVLNREGGRADEEAPKKRGNK